eukprot:8860508-Pyramimonas_sp.AAC.1
MRRRSRRHPRQTPRYQLGRTAHDRGPDARWITPLSHEVHSRPQLGSAMSPPEVHFIDEMRLVLAAAHSPWPHSKI